MKLLLILASFFILSIVGTQEGLAYEKGWKYDGVVTLEGCITLGGSILDVAKQWDCQSVDAVRERGHRRIAIRARVATLEICAGRLLAGAPDQSNDSRSKGGTS